MIDYSEFYQFFLYGIPVGVALAALFSIMGLSIGLLFKVMQVKP